MSCDDDGCVTMQIDLRAAVPCLGQASRMAFKQMKPVSVAMAVFDPLCMRQHEGLYRLVLGQHLVVYFKGMCILGKVLIHLWLWRGKLLDLQPQAMLQKSRVASRAVDHPVAYSRFIDVAAEIVIVYAWTYGLWFWVAYAFFLFSLDAIVAFVIAIHGERHVGGVEEAAMYCLKAMG
nr:hypothetical protein [Tanacetum cinerariifolium]